MNSSELLNLRWGDCGNPKYVVGWAEVGVAWAPQCVWYLKSGKACGTSPSPVGSVLSPGSQCQNSPILLNACLVSGVLETA